MTTLDRIRAQAAAHPDRTAYRAGEDRISYGSLWARAENAARLLTRLNRGNTAPSLPGPAPVLLDGSKSPDAAAAIVGCLIAGIPYVPVAPSVPPARLRSILGQTGAKILLAGRDFPHAGEGLLRIPLEEIGLDREPGAGNPDDPPSRYAYIIFTSGSTGEPKGVPVFRDSLDSFTRWIGSLPPLDGYRDITVMNQALFSFDLSVADFYYALTNGHTAAAFRNEEELARILPEADAAVMTPTFLRQLLLDRDFRAGKLPRLKCVWLCGEVLSPAAAKQALDAFPDLALINAYGPTEACCAVSAVRIDRDAVSGSAADMSPLPVGALAGAAAGIAVEEGEIVLSGKSVFGGYLGGAEGGHFRENGVDCYRTGDLGRIRGGLLYCSGRKDGQIKYKGYRIELSDIEANLAALPGVTGCAVTAKRGRDGEVTAIRAFVTADQAASPAVTPEGLKSALAETLPAYMIPKVIRLMDRLPVTENGKTDRKALEAL